MPSQTRKISSLTGQSISMCDTKLWILNDYTTINEYNINTPSGYFFPYFNRSIQTELDAFSSLPITISGLTSVSADTFITITVGGDIINNWEIGVPPYFITSPCLTYINTSGSTAIFTEVIYNSFLSLNGQRNFHDFLYIDQGDKYLIFTSSRISNNTHYISQLNLKTKLFDCEYDLTSGGLTNPKTIYQSPGGKLIDVMYVVDGDALSSVYQISFTDGSLTYFGDDYINYGLSATTDSAQSNNNDLNLVNCAAGYFQSLPINTTVYGFAGGCSKNNNNESILVFSSGNTFQTGSSYIFRDAYYTIPYTSSTYYYSGKCYSINTSNGLVQSVTALTACCQSSVISQCYTGFTNISYYNNLSVPVNFTTVTCPGCNVSGSEKFTYTIPPQTELNFCWCTGSTSLLHYISGATIGSGGLKSCP